MARVVLGMVFLILASGTVSAEQGGGAGSGLKLDVPGVDNKYPELPEKTTKYVPLSASDELGVSNLEYGVFQTRSAQDEDEPGEGITLAWGGKQPITETTYIPARIGVKFGMRYNLDGPGSRRPVRVKLLYLTPGLVDPTSGKHQDKIEIVQELSPKARYHVMAFQFAEAFEIIPGAWHMYVFHEDRKLLEKTFTVVK